jgi:hypothetical protein
VQGSYYEGAVRMYRLMQGKNGRTDETFINPVTGLPTPYMFSGDLLIGEGWIDGVDFSPGDRSIGLASGPFNMAVGDTQEIIIAEIAALGMDRLDSYKVLKYYSERAQDAFDTGYYQNFAPKPPIPQVSVERTGPKVKLNWGTDQQSVEQIENFDQSDYKFQGYNVYQSNSLFYTKENSVRIATFDIADGVTEIPGTIMDPETGLAIEGIEQHGSDSGIERRLSVDYDYIQNSHLIVGKKYYYAVTAYTYNPDPEAFTNNSERLINTIEVTYFDGLPGASYGDKVSVEHTEGKADAKISITIEDPTKITGNDYEIFFTEEAEIRNENGDWVSASNVLRKFDSNDPDTLTGTTIDIAAVHGADSNSAELRFHLDIVSQNDEWVDGIILTFPDNVTIISSPEFYAQGGLVEPEIIGQEIHYGITDNSGTGNGIFHDGGEDWFVIVAPITPPIAVDWIAFGDGYAGGGPPETGTTIVTEVGFESRIAQYWNIFDLTTDVMVLEKQSIVNNYYMYPPRDDVPEYFNRVDSPIADGFQTDVDLSFEEPIEFYRIDLINNPTGLTQLTSNGWGDDETIDISNYTIFGSATSKAIDIFGIGTNELSELQQDYELRFTGVWDSMMVGSQFVHYIKSGGQMATVFRMINGSALADHPLNPNPGTAAPFLVRIPFEVWNVDDDDPANHFQINITFRDRTSDGTEDQFKVWKTNTRMYAILVNSPYDPTQVIQVDGGPDQFNDPATWVLVFYALNYHGTEDVVSVVYANPIQFGIDKYQFTTPEPIDSVNFIIPREYLLFQNYPNPFNPGTTIQFDLPEDGLVTLEVYDILGQRVVQLINTEMPLGRHEAYFNGNIFASGVYIYVLNISDKFFKAKKMILLK